MKLLSGLILLLALPVFAAVSRDEFHAVIRVFEQEFARDAAELDRVFEIHHDWKQDWAQAFARRWETDHLVVYGGAARITGGTVDSFALILCHEVGHLYGGFPFSDVYNQISVEGQADYWATNVCWERIANDLPNVVGDSVARARVAAQILTHYFALTRGLPAPRPETPDLLEVARTTLTHPSPQCRLDTFLAGQRAAPRPLCWFAP